MEFLKAIYGDKALTYEELIQAINAHNGDEANKDKQIKIANLNSGEYVSKLKYEDISQQLTGKQSELDKANGLIAELQKATKADEGLQQKITDYETEKAQLQAELAETKLKSAIKVALLSEKAVDVDYLTFKLNEKLKEKGETLELDENDNIKGWGDKLNGLKTQFPNMFGSGDGGNGGYKPLGNGGLPKGDPNKSTEPKSLEEALKLQYEGNGE